MSSNQAILRRIASLRSRYEAEVMGVWTERKTTFLNDWFEALDFLLAHVFFQGRNDTLSERYYEASEHILREYFGEQASERKAAMKRAWDARWIPHDPKWYEYEEKGNRLAEALFAGACGKQRDQWMVLDALRYVHALPNWNIVGHSCNRIRAGATQEHFRELQTICQVGPKTASFYLRDLCWLFGIDVETAQLEATQPIDTWVRQVASHPRVAIFEADEDDASARTKLVQACLVAGIAPADFNVGAWYLGTRTLDVALELAEQPVVVSSNNGASDTS